MKASVNLIILSLLLFSCDKEITELKTVFPDYLHSSRTPNRIELSWNSPMFYMIWTPDFYKSFANPESYEIYLSKGDTLNFELVDRFNGEAHQYTYAENENGIDYFFKLRCLAKGAVSSFSKIVWVNGGLNPELSMLLDFEQNHATIGDISADESKILINSYPSGSKPQGIMFYDLNTTTGSVIIGNAESAVFSLDEKSIAFTSYFGDYSMKPNGRNLGMIHIETGVIDTLTAGPYSIYSAVFSYGNSEIYFHNSPYGGENQM